MTIERLTESCQKLSNSVSADEVDDHRDFDLRSKSVLSVAPVAAASGAPASGASKSIVSGVAFITTGFRTVLILQGANNTHRFCQSEHTIERCQW